MRRSLPEITRKIKQLLLEDLFVILIVLSVGFAGFGLGRLSAREEQTSAVQIGHSSLKALRATAADALENDNFGSGLYESTAIENTAEGGYVASTNGSRYHFPWCSGAQRIKPENLIWFTTRAEAEAAGYTPAQNCKGL